LSAQKSGDKEQKKQLTIPEEVQDDLLRRENFYATPFPPGPSPKLLNIRTGGGMYRKHQFVLPAIR
jgi:hypothetical protein